MAEKVEVPVTFPNESYPIVIPFDWDDFVVEKVFTDVSFGWMGGKQDGIWVNIENKYIPKEKFPVTE
jgi:hypothetical protein